MIQKCFIAKRVGLFLDWLCWISLNWNSVHFCYSNFNSINYGECDPVRMRILDSNNLQQNLLGEFNWCVCVNLFPLLSTWIYVNDGTGRAVTVSVWSYHTDMVGLSAGESVNCTGGVVHALTVGEMAVTVLKHSRVRSCSCALLPEHGQAIPLADHISGHIFRHTGHWTWEKWLSVKLSD